MEDNKYIIACNKCFIDITEEIKRYGFCYKCSKCKQHTHGVKILTDEQAREAYSAWVKEACEQLQEELGKAETSRNNSIFYFNKYREANKK